VLRSAAECYGVVRSAVLCAAFCSGFIDKTKQRAVHHPTRHPPLAQKLAHNARERLRRADAQDLARGPLERGVGPRLEQLGGVPVAEERLQAHAGVLISIF